MDCGWIKISPRFKKGIEVINQLEETRSEQFLRRIFSKLRLNDKEIFSGEEKAKLVKIFQIDEESLLLCIQSLIYLFKRLLKYIFMPLNIKQDLKTIGFSNKIADCLVNIWSNETHATLNKLNSDTISKSDSLHFSWKLNAELSSELLKKCRVPKAHISFTDRINETKMELTHSELYSIFLQFEAITNELDNLFI